MTRLAAETMTRLTAASVLIGIAGLAPSPSRAGDALEELVPAASFDGSRGAPVAAAGAPSVPSLEGPVAVASAAPVIRTKQTGADLFYFTPEEAALARKRFKGRKDARTGLTFDSDVPGDIQAQMRADLAFIQSVQGQGSTPLHQKIFGAVDGSVYGKFFESRVKSIGMNDCGSSSAVACVIPYEDSSKMWLTRNFVDFSHPQIARLMVVFHEARHTEVEHGNWPHGTCPTPFRDESGNDRKSIWTGALLQGQPACDWTALGSYGSSTIMLKNVQKYCKSCTDKVRLDAGLYSDDQLNRITDSGVKQQMIDDFKKGA